MILVTAGDTRSLAGRKSYLFIYFTLGVHLDMTAPFVLLMKHVKKGNANSFPVSLPARSGPAVGCGQHPPASGEQWQEPTGAVWSLSPPTATAALQPRPGRWRPPPAPPPAEDVWEAGFTGPAANGTQVLEWANVLSSTLIMERLVQQQLPGAVSCDRLCCC